jgi:hypothetical protein
MSGADLAAAAAGVLVTVASIVLGAWLDLRSGMGAGESPAASPAKENGVADSPGKAGSVR